MTDVFISYSRHNLDFVHRLDAALTAQGKASWFDQKKEPLEGIPPGSKWWEEIKYGIETADNFLFIISPESVVSPYCNAEIAYALHHEKRIVTVLYCHTNSEADTLLGIDAAIDAIPGISELPSSVSSTITNLRSLTYRNWLEISKVQYVAFSDGGSFDQSVAALALAFDMDLAWIKTWSQIRQSARIWQETGDDSYLWSELRLKPVREIAEKRAQPMTDIERKFLRSEVDRLVEQLQNDSLDHAARVGIGERLHVIGDTRPGVGLRPDGLPDIVWCAVPGGKVTFSDYGKLVTFEVQPFSIAKYPVTLRQFQAFIDAPDGFANPNWWRGLAADRGHKAAPETQYFRFSNNPRDNVSWYDAVAFCQWLSALSGEEIRLPTEWEWQQAATGGNPHNKYPWGSDWEKGRRCNTNESGLRRTTAVGMYPQGASPVGALEMSGNIGEWCLNEYDTPANVKLSGYIARRVWRGGPYHLNQEYAYAVARSYGNPNNRTSGCGFRVARVPHPDSIAVR